MQSQLEKLRYFRGITMRYSCLWCIFVYLPCGTRAYDIFSSHFHAVLVLAIYFPYITCGTRAYDVSSYHFHAVFVPMMYFRIITMQSSYVWYIFVSLPCGTRTYDVFSYHYKVVILFSHLLTYIVTWWCHMCTVFIIF